MSDVEIVAIVATVLLVPIQAAIWIPYRRHRKRTRRIEGWWHGVHHPNPSIWTASAWEDACRTSAERSKERRDG